MLRWIKAIVIVALLPYASMSQSGLSLYSLGELVPQNNHFNPALIPEGRFFLGLPVISEAGLHVNNKFSYEQAIEKYGEDSSRLDVENVLGVLREKNNFLAETRIPLLFVGIQPEGARFAFTLFLNERAGIGLQYQKVFVETVWKGTGHLAGNSINLRRSAVSATHHREYGMGVKAELPGKSLRVGVRLKVLQGLLNVKTRAGMSAAISLEPITYAYGFAFRSAGINAAGLDNYANTSYFIFNKNRGVAVDAGASWAINHKVSFSAAINDLGVICWKESPVNFSLKDTTFRFEGVDMRTPADLTTAIDTLEKAFAPEKRQNAYRAMLSARSVAGISWLLTPVDRLSFSLMNQMLVGKIKTAVAVALTKQIRPGVAVSAGINKLPQQWPTAGAAVALKGGPVQFYFASDNLIGFVNVADMKVLDMRLGANLIFGAKKRGEKIPQAPKPSLAQ